MERLMGGILVSKARFEDIHRPGHGPAHETARNMKRDGKDLEIRERPQKFSAPRDRKGAKNDAFRHVLGRKVQKISRSKYFYFA